MKRTKKQTSIIPVLLGLLLAAGLLLSSCSNVFFDAPKSTGPVKPGYGKLFIQIAGEEGRTIFPSVSFDELKYSYMEWDEETDDWGEWIPFDEQQKESDGSFTLFAKVLLRVKVEAYIGAVLAATGESEEFTLDSSEEGTIITIDLNLDEQLLVGEGTFSFNIKFPYGAELETFALYELPGMTQVQDFEPENADFDKDDSDGITVTFSGDFELDKGTYLLSIKLSYDNETTVLYAGASEVIYIYPGLPSVYNAEFDESHFSSLLTLSVNLVNPSGVLTPLNTEAEFTVTVSGINKPSDADKIGLNIVPITGLDFSGDRAADGSFSGETKTFSVKVEFDDNQAFSSGSAGITINGLSGSLSAAYNQYNDTKSGTVYIIDGRSESNAIPLNTGNFEDFADYVSTTAGLGRYYKLEENITLSDPWTPIGSESDPFTGYFDGDGKLITGFEIDSTDDAQGFFGSIGTGGVLKNLGLAGNVKGGEKVGGLAGINAGTIDKCYFTGTVVASDYAGGLVGTNSGTVSNCVALNSIVTVASGAGDYGRVIGYNDMGTLSNNKAREDMVVGVEGSEDIKEGTTATSINGIDAASLPPAIFDGWATVPQLAAAVVPELELDGPYSFADVFSLSYKTAPAAKTVTITNLGPVMARISDVSLSGSQAASFELNDSNLPASIPQGETVSFTVRPIPGLRARIHNASVSVAYNGSMSATAPVQFTVTNDLDPPELYDWVIAGSATSNVSINTYDLLSFGQDSSFKQGWFLQNIEGEWLDGAMVEGEFVMNQNLPGSGGLINPNNGSGGTIGSLGTYYIRIEGPTSPVQNNWRVMRLTINMPVQYDKLKTTLSGQGLRQDGNPGNLNNGSDGETVPPWEENEYKQTLTYFFEAKTNGGVASFNVAFDIDISAEWEYVEEEISLSYPVFKQDDAEIYYWEGVDGLYWNLDTEPISSYPGGFVPGSGDTITIVSPIKSGDDEPPVNPGDVFFRRDDENGPDIKYYNFTAPQRVPNMIYLIIDSVQVGTATVTLNQVQFDDVLTDFDDSTPLATETGIVVSNNFSIEYDLDPDFADYVTAYTCNPSDSGGTVDSSNTIDFTKIKPGIFQIVTRFEIDLP